MAGLAGSQRVLITDEAQDGGMHKTKLYAWIAIGFCLVAVATEAVQAGSVHLPF
jgi:hypothetical protein